MKKVTQKRAGAVPGMSELSEARLQRVRGGATQVEYALLIASIDGAGEPLKPQR